MSRNICTSLTIVGLLGTLSGLAPTVSANVITFDNQPAGIRTGDALLASGVEFTTVASHGAVTVGSALTLCEPDPRFSVFSDSSSISPPKFAVPLDGGGNDLLIHFTSPVTSVSLTTDDYPYEGPDIVRLLALSPTSNPLKYTVLDIAEGWDNALTAPYNLLAVDNGGLGFSFALFQATTETEGFDDLTFTLAPSQVPEPGSVLMFTGLVTSGAMALLCRRKNGR